MDQTKLNPNHLFEYGSRWNSADHCFGHPWRLYEPIPPSFPDVHFRAATLTQAMKLIEKLNERMQGVDREEFDAERYLEELPRSLF